MTKNETHILQLQQYNIRLCIIPRNYVSFSISQNFQTSMVDGKQQHIVSFLVSGGRKIASRLLSLLSLGMENSTWSI